MLFDPDADVRASASNMVAAFERYPDGALPLLLKAMESEDAFVRHHAPHMLSYMGKNDQVVAALRKGMQDRDFMVRNNAGVALGKILDDFSIPIPCWLEAIGKSEENQLAKKPILEKEEAHLMNMLALSTATLFHDESRNNPKRFADALVKQLDHASPLVRRIAVRQLGAAAIDNPKLKEVFQSMQLLKTLQRFVDDADTRMRAEVKTAIERIQQK
jgi:HEAT repeat protein